MWNVTIKGLVAHRRRLASTFLAVVLGVGFLTGNLVLSKTIQRTFDDLFADVNRGTDVYVRNATKVETGFGNEIRGRIDVALVDAVRGVRGVKAAEPQVLGYGQIVGKDGKALGNPGAGAPTFAGNWPTVPQLNPFRLAGGRAPAREAEVVIDRKSSTDGELAPGDHTKVLVADGPVDVTVVGVARFGRADSPGGASMALMTLDAAQRHVSRPGQVDGIAAVGTGDVSQQGLARRVQEVLPAGAEAITGARLTKENQDNIQKGLSQFLNFLLLPFAVIAVLVAVFSIYNTFSIIVAQRTREMALLRALGAARRQVLLSVIAEALVVGLLASVAGLFAGLGVAGLLKGLLKQFGVDIPAGGLEVRPSTIVAAFVVGLGVTAVTAIIPAVKASRVPPMAAMRDIALERTHASRTRIAAGVVGAVVGGVLIGLGVAAKGNTGLARIGAGAMVLIVAVVVTGPAVAKPVAQVIGAPLPRVRGITGKLARENAMRNPRRTSGTATALLIGVAVVALFTIFAASLKASVNHQIDKSFAADLVVDSQTRGFGGFNPKLAADIAKLPEVKAATGVRMGAARVDGTSHALVVIDPTGVERVMDLGVRAGSLRDLGGERVAVSRRYSEEHGWRLGRPVTVTFPDGATAPFVVGALFENRDVVSTDFVMSTAAWSPHATDDLDARVLVRLEDGVALARGKAAVERAGRAYANAKVEDRRSFADTISAQVDQLLGLVYVMLLVAIIIAVMGIANTLALSIYERTRELGLLRAVGETRSQLRSMVRWESVIIAVFGTIGGLVLGTVCGWALVTAGSDSGFVTFALPVSSLTVLLVLGGLAGVVAGLRPARRAARLDVLRAIAAE